MKWAAPHLGQCRSASAGWFAVVIAVSSLASSGRSRLDGPATESIEIELTLRRTAALDICQLYLHSAHVLSYACGCHGNRMR